MAVAMIPLIKEWMLHFLQKLNMEQLELNFTGMHRVYIFCYFWVFSYFLEFYFVFFLILYIVSSWFI
jgi:hypothetical protein